MGDANIVSYLDSTAVVKVTAKVYHRMFTNATFAYVEKFAVPVYRRRKRNLYSKQSQPNIPQWIREDFFCEVEERNKEEFELE